MSESRVPQESERGRPGVSVSALLLGSGPRFARDALGPVLVFYLGWKLVGLTAGIVGATVVALIAYGWERRQARSGVSATLGLGIALVQAIVGLASGSAIAFFGPPVIINGIYGLAFVVSVISGRPLAGVFAQETYPFPPEVKASATINVVTGIPFTAALMTWSIWYGLRGFRRSEEWGWAVRSR